MKIFVSALVVVAVILVAGWEALWRFDHRPLTDAFRSPNGDFVSQARSMPEGSVSPYGTGVFVRRTYIPLWASSQLTLFGYCGPEVDLSWSPSNQLIVDCVADLDSPMQFLPHNGVPVIHNGAAQQVQ